LFSVEKNSLNNDNERGFKASPVTLNRDRFDMIELDSDEL